ncbi:MAG: response regulator transcription factor [Deltaproteobacteria bacterium]|nr:response regulator transcription factor [Deltaproteobacteria bacterium]
MSTILVIEDDSSIRVGLVETLRAKGYQVNAAARGGEGLALCASSPPDLVILDLMLPDMEGFEVCRQLKGSPQADVPVIMLTARGAELDRVRGLELGADDYVTKPFSLMELLARIGVVLRRSGRGRPMEGGIEEIRFGEVVVNFRRHEGRKGTTPLSLSDRGYLILQVFAQHRGEVLSREQLLQEAWGYSRELNTRTVDNHVVKIRKEIEDDPNNPRYLVTVHGVGYKLAI